MFDYKNEMFAQQVLDQVKHIYKKNLRVNLVQCQLPNLLQLMWNLWLNQLWWWVMNIIKSCYLGGIIAKTDVEKKKILQDSLSCEYKDALDLYWNKKQLMNIDNVILKNHDKML